MHVLGHTDRSCNGREYCCLVRPTVTVNKLLAAFQLLFLRYSLYHLYIFFVHLNTEDASSTLCSSAVFAG